MGEISEIKDIQETKLQEAEDYKEIKPEGSSNPEEARSFIDGLFGQEIDDSENDAPQNPHEEILDGKRYFYDDNGILYRVENELAPNADYEINGYKYTTDDKGRIMSAEGKLRMKEHVGRLPIKDSLEDIGKGDEIEGDDRGHLIGDQFGGSNRLENMIPQDANINRNEFKKFENELAQEVKNGKEVIVKMEPVYDGNSRRPDAIIVIYSIDGNESVTIFPNSQEA